MINSLPAFSSQARAPSEQQDGAVGPALAEHVAAIKTLGRRVVADAIEIGRRLVDCRDNHLKHGEYLPWLRREFGWSRQSADNFIHVYEAEAQGKLPNFGNLDLPVSALYLLAAPSTPTEARTEILERAQAGEPVSVAAIKETIKKAKGCKQPVKRKPTPTEADQEAWDAGEISRDEAERRDIATRSPMPARDDIMRRLQRENIALRSEIEAAKATRPLDSRSWATASSSERAQFLGSIGRSGILAAVPAKWDLRSRMLRAVPVAMLLDEFERRLPPKLWKKYQSALKAIHRGLDAPEQYAGPTLEASATTDTEVTKH